MSKNLAFLSKENIDKIKVDFAAAGVAFRERYKMPIVPEIVENEQPEHLRNWFRKRLIAYRLLSAKLPKLPYKPKIK